MVETKSINSNSTNISDADNASSNINKQVVAIKGRMLISRIIQMQVALETFIRVAILVQIKQGNQTLYQKAPIQWEVRRNAAKMVSNPIEFAKRVEQK